MARSGEGFESEPLVGPALDPLARSRDPDDPDVDLVLAGAVYFDIVFTGLAVPPAVGTEVHTEGMGSCPGGVANVAVAGSRLGLRTAVAAAFGEDVYGDFSWETLGEQELVDLSSSRRFPDWHSPITVSVSYRGDRSMVTHEHEPPVPIAQLAVGLPPARAVFTSIRGDELPAWVRSRSERGEKIFADVGWDPTETWPTHTLDQLASCHAFMPNAVEAMSYTRTGSPESALAKLADLVPVAVVTDGPRGALAVDQQTGESAQVEGLVVDAIDATGAGDIFGAAFIVGTLAGWPLTERLRFANLCAALSVQHNGGSLSAPGWADIAYWWAHRPESEATKCYGFLAQLIPPAWQPTDTRRAQATIGLRHR
ncbi:MAG: carbohydrate kinase family protein [Jiangellaceae bacterium]